MIFTAIISFVLLLLMYYYYQHYGRNGRLINEIPGPPTLPIFGNALSLYGSGEYLWSFFDRSGYKHHPIYKFWVFLQPIIVSAHPDYMEAILSSTKHSTKGQFYKLLYPWLGTGLLTSGGAKWRSRRKILTPAFHFNILQQFVVDLIKQGECLTKFLKNKEGAVVMDIESLMSEYTLNAICETAMDTSLQNLGPFQKEYRQAIHGMGDILFYRFLRPWMFNDWVFSLTSMSKLQDKYLKILHGFTEKIIRERKQYHEDTNGQYLKNFENHTELGTNSEEKTGASRKRLALLDLLIAASQENQMSDADIREEIDTFMFEGHDTVAIAITFALLLLAEHKDIQDKIRTEVNAVTQKTEGKLTYSSLQNLPYLDRCIKESLRLYPSVPYIQRITIEDLKIDSYVVPAGTHITVNIHHLHKDPDCWPNPDVFDPNRFLEEEMKNRHSYWYLPFSAGPRNCIGQRYALLEMKTMIAPLIQNFYLEPVDRLKDIKRRMDIVNRLAQPAYIKFVPIGSK